MKHIIKILIFIIVFVILTMFFSPSFSKVSIDNIAVVVAIGMDVVSDSNTQNNIKVSFQFTDASSVSESGSTEKAPSILKTVSASSIISAINLINTYIDKEVTLSHCKLIVFSEEIAKKGIADDIYTLINNTQVRPTANIVVSKCTAQEYIENSKPLFEPLISKYYEVFVSSSKYTGYTVNAKIGDFFDKMVCHACEPYAILGAPSENIGMAVFKDGTLVGELDAIETLSFMCIGNDVEGFLISVPNPSVENAYIDVYMTPSKSPKIKVSLVNGSPYVTIDCKFSGKIVSMEKNANYLDFKALSDVSDSCNRYLEYIFSEYLYKTSKDFKSDISGIGKYAKNLFMTSDSFESFDWCDSFSDCFFDVTVKSNVKSASLISNS